MKVQRRSIASLVTIGMLAVTVGCSSGNSQTGEPKFSQDNSPLSEMISAAFGTNLDPNEQQRKEAEIQQGAQEIIAQCMKEAGFEYFIEEPAKGFEPLEQFPNDREWVAQWGYGWSYQAVPMNEWYQSEYVDKVNPNEAYFESLSEAEQIAYGQALSPTTLDGKSAGCSGLGGAYLNEHHSTALVTSDEFYPLFMAINAFNQEKSRLNELSQVENDWVFCMADAGYPGFERQVDARAKFYRAVSEFDQNWNGSEDDRYNSDEFSDLASLEAKLALADFDCRVATNYQERRDEVVFTAEKQFIADHKVEIDALLSAAEQYAL